MAELFRVGVLGKLLSCLILAFALLQFLVANFTPYPVAVPPALESISSLIRSRASAAWGGPIQRNPVAEGDLWGQEWVVKTIEQAEGASARLNILPSTSEISVHSVDLCALLNRTRFEISTFRQYTLRGDLVPFDPPAIAYYDWYLLKSGEQGSPLADSSSQANYAKLVEYIENSGRFQLQGSKVLPDKSNLMLYRLKR